MKKISLLLTLGICTLLTSNMIPKQNNSIAAFNPVTCKTEIKDYSIEELLEKFFKDKDVNITKISETEFYINDSNYYLSYVNGDISYTHKYFKRSNQTTFNNIILHNSLEILNDEYDTKEIEGITRMQALEQVKLVAHKLGLEVEEEPYMFLDLKSDNISRMNKKLNLNNGVMEAFKVKTSWVQKEDCYYILWNDILSTTAYKTINDNSSKYTNYGEIIGTAIFAVVTKDGIIELEISKIYGAIQGTVEN